MLEIKMYSTLGHVLIVLIADSILKSYSSLNDKTTQIMIKHRTDYCLKEIAKLNYFVLIKLTISFSFRCINFIKKSCIICITLDIPITFNFKNFFYLTRREFQICIGPTEL